MKIQGWRQQIRKQESVSGENSLYQCRQMIFYSIYMNIMRVICHLLNKIKNGVLLYIWEVERQKKLPAQSL